MQQNASSSNEVEYPLDKKTVFHALLAVVKREKSAKLKSADELTGRVTIETAGGLFSWPVGVIFTLSESVPKRTHLRMAVDTSGSATVARGLTQMAQRANKVPDSGNVFESAQTGAVVSAILNALSSELTAIIAKLPPEAPKEKECPFCGETIKIQAVKCRFCAADLVQQAASQPTALASPIPPQPQVPLAPPTLPPPTPPVQTSRQVPPPMPKPATPKEPRALCPACQQKVAFPKEMTGQQINCPTCGGAMNLDDYSNVVA